MKTALLIFSLFLLNVQAQAGTLKTPAGNWLTWHLPAGWEIASTPPRSLLNETLQALAEEARSRNTAPSPEQLEQAALMRLAANELLLVHPESGAWIGFDFSPLRQGEAQPPRESLRLSASYALDSLQNEPGIELFDRTVQTFPLPGARYTQKIVAHYLKARKDIVLQGLIGALPGEWFYIYATSYPSKMNLSKQIEELFGQLAFTP